MSGYSKTLGQGSTTSGNTGVDIAYTLLARLPMEAASGEDLLAVVAAALGWEAAALWEREGGGEGVTCTATWSSTDSSSSRTPLGGILSTVAERALVTGAPSWSEVDGRAESLGPVDPWPTVLAFPITETGHLTGVVELFRSEPVLPDPEVLETVAALATPLGGWLENRRRQEQRHRLLSRLSTAERRQRFLAEVSAVLAGTLDDRRMLEDLARLVASRVADFCSIYLVNDDGSVSLVAMEAAGPARRETERMMGHAPGLDSKEGVGRVLRTGMPILYPKITDELLRAVARDEEHLGALRRLGPESAMIVPLPGRGRTLGALALASLEPDRIYSADDLAVMEDVGRRAGLAIAGAQLYRRERATAATLQEGLLPPALPEIPGMRLAGRYRAGEEGLVVGGDFYEAFQIADDTWILGIGDVCGHGPAAAALSSRVRHSARALAEFCLGPAELLVRLNRLLREDPSELPFCTCVYVWLAKDGDGTWITLARGGHPLPVLRRKDGELEELAPKGQVLGVFDNVHIEATTVRLEPGDLLVLYTDGVTEARRDGELLGSARLLELLDATSPSEAEATAKAIEEMALNHSGGRLRDDIAILVVAVETG